MIYGITPAKKAELERLIAAGKITSVGVTRGGGVRQVTHVKVTGEPDVDGFFPCIPLGYDVVNEIWIEFNESLVFDPNERYLNIDEYYTAIRYGLSGDTWVFATTDGANLPGCGLLQQENDDGYLETVVDLPNLAGMHLMVEEDDEDSDSCDKLAVDLSTVPGCHIEFVPVDGDEPSHLAVTPATLAGMHLMVEDDDDDSDSCDKLAVDLSNVPGCHLEYIEATEDEPSHLAVTPATLVGEGLIFEEGETEEDCDKIAFPLEVISEEELGPFILADGFQFTIEDCAVVIRAYTQSMTKYANQDGVIVGLLQGPEAAELTELGTIDLRETCECCGEEPPGWECTDGSCVETVGGTFPSLESCEAVCNDSDDSDDSSGEPCICEEVGCEVYTVEAHGIYPADELVRTCFTAPDGGCSYWWVGSEYSMVQTGSDTIGLVYPALGSPLEYSAFLTEGCIWNGPDESRTMTGCGTWTPTTVGGWACGEVEVCCGEDSDDDSSDSPVMGWNCADNICVEEEGGTYATEAECLENCDLDSSGSDSDSGSGGPLLMRKTIPTTNHFAPLMTEGERSELLNLLKRVDTALGTTQYALCWGALLGYVRNGNLLPWDDDLDLIVINCPSVSELQQRLPGLQVQLDQQGYIKVFDPANPNIKGREWSFPFLELIPGTVEGEHIRSKSAFEKPDSLIPIDMLFPAQRGKLAGVECNIPAKPKDLAVHLFGNQCLTSALPPKWSHKHEKPTNFPQLRKPLSELFPSLLDGSYLINLKRRPDRLEEALAQFQAIGVEPKLYEAVDGTKLPLPEGWIAGSGAYGCRESHRAILAEAIMSNRDTVTVFEDDVVFVKDFHAKLAKFLAAVPNDWDALFLGGQHMEQHRTPPIDLGNGVLKCVNTHRTHAYMIRGEYLKFMYQKWSSNNTHIDHTWGNFQKDWKVYAPAKWLCGQSEGVSDIKRKHLPERFWEPKKLKEPKCGTCNKRKELARKKLK